MHAVRRLFLWSFVCVDDVRLIYVFISTSWLIFPRLLYTGITASDLAAGQAADGPVTARVEAGWYGGDYRDLPLTTLVDDAAGPNPEVDRERGVRVEDPAVVCG